jgi:pimeloyl-ACP methyl ester carboxylesterase
MTITKDVIPGEMTGFIKWDLDETASGLVPVDDCNLFLSVAGPPRDPTQPVVIVEAGMGDGARSWTAVQHLVSQHARIYTYDHAGIGRSSKSKAPRDAASIAKQLSTLLAVTQIQPPYFLVAHTYGAITAREFFALQPETVAAMLFIDPTHEREITEMPPPWESMFAVLGNLDYFEVTRLNQEHKLLPEEWQAIKDDAGHNDDATDAEGNSEDLSYSALAKKRQIETQALGDRPVVVFKCNSLQDYSRIYDAGIKAGNGTEGQRAALREQMRLMSFKEEELQREILRLSSDSRFVYTADHGNKVHVTNPQGIADEILRILAQIK